VSQPEVKGEFKPAPEVDNNREKRKDDILKKVRVGMTKKTLYKLFGRYYRTGYRLEGNEEWVTFSDRKSDERDAITFYLKKGKVKSWRLE